MKLPDVRNPATRTVAVFLAVLGIFGGKVVGNARNAPRPPMV